MNTRFMIAVTEAGEAAKKQLALKAKVRAAMEITKNHWMLTDEDLRFKAAIAGALVACDLDEDREILTSEVRALNSLSAIFMGVPVDFSKLKTPKNPIGLMKLWIEIKEKK